MARRGRRGHPPALFTAPVLAARPTDRINLTLHGVGPRTRQVDPGEDDVWVGADVFASVLDVAAGRPEVRITFDDGNASDVAVALPALRARGLSATFFVLAGRLGEPEYLSDDDVRALAAAGMTIGNHGMHHRSWRALGDDALSEELVTARRMLEDIVGRPVDEASFPFGAYDRRVVAALRRHGYRRAFTSDGGPARAGAWLQARTSLRKTDARPEIQRMLSSDARPLAAAVRSAKMAVKRWR